MSATTRKWLGITGSSVVLLAVIYWLTSPHTAEPSTPQPIPPAAVAAPKPASIATAATSETAVSSSASANTQAQPIAVPFPNVPTVWTTQTPKVVIPEAVGTRRMYAAHAPLRTNTIADPDSTENRQILQTMVTKALNRATGN